MIDQIEAKALRDKIGYGRARGSLFPGNVVAAVKSVIEDVRLYGDEAVKAYSAKYDGAPVDMEIKVGREELHRWAGEVSTEELEALRTAINNIRNFHANQVSESWKITTEGKSILGNIVRPVESVGVYVPGGTAAYPSSVIMNVVPAQIAGVEKIVIFTPPCSDGSINRYVAAAALELGICSIFRIGGAQAVAAAAYGTETVPKVDKIVGPGNAYVAAAKREVYGIVDIDMIAGPSEIVIIADEGARADYIAADMLSQAEHDAMAKAILITTSKAFGAKVALELKRQIKLIKREEIAAAALRENGAICIVENISEGIELANFIAPEHLELAINDAEKQAANIKNAGAIFIGEYSSEPIGDYIAGPNHVLPTNGTARFFSPLTVKDFQKISSLICYSREDYYKYAPKAIRIAEAEGLHAHANAMKARFKYEQG